MKIKLFKSLLVACLATSSIFAQTSVRFEIIHKLHGEDFNHQQTTFNDLGITFNTSRLQYYISGISVTHDGGENTEFPDTYILVNAAGATNVLLGTDTIDSIESISFHIGVDEARNHLDPSIYASSHPLAFKNPDMHWGWTAGYRFVAIEGKIGPNVENGLTMHALGDDNYFETTVDVGVKAENGAATVSIYGNYAHALNSLDLADGYSLHSEFFECITILENFRDYVFSAEVPADTTLPAIPVDTTDTTDISYVGESFGVDLVQVYPNPATDQFIIGGESDFEGQLNIYSLQGKWLESHNLVGREKMISTAHLPRGTYILSIKNDAVDIRRLLILE